MTDSPNLYSINSILVTTGMNENDVYFGRAETYEARNSPLDNYFNDSHVESKIIGHIKTVSIMDEDGKISATDIKFEDLTEKFHIYTGSVIYAYYDDEKLMKFVAGLIKDIEDGKKYVSMEALYGSFDYVLFDRNSEGKAENLKFISRNDQTKFLDKYLRLFKGVGMYSGRKIGIYPKKITFVGHGLVDNPGNKESEIFDTNNKRLSKKIQEKIVSSKKDVYPPLRNEVKTMNEEVEKLKKDLAEAETKIKTLESEATKESAKKLEAKLSELEGSLAKELEAKKAVADENEKLKAELEKTKLEAERSTKDLAEATGKLNEITEKERQAKRLVAATDAGHGKPEEFVADFATDSDEVFEKAIKAMKSLVKVEAIKEEPKVEPKEDVEGKAKAALDEVKVEVEADGVVPAPDANAENGKLEASMSDYFKNRKIKIKANKTNKAKKDKE